MEIFLYKAMMNIDNKNPYGGSIKRIGILGGTFDPVHRGHIHMAEAALYQLDLDRVVFMVSGQPPHKNHVITDAKHRLAMLDVALGQNSRYRIDPHELRVDAPSYTFESMKRIRNSIGEGVKVYFIIGADSLMDLEKWYEPAKLMTMTAFAVIPRPGFSKSECLAQIANLEKKYSACIAYVDCQSVYVSSTEIRKALYRGENIEDEIPMGVLEYIDTHHLYKAEGV